MFDVHFRQAYKEYHSTQFGQSATLSRYTWDVLRDKIESIGYAFDGVETQKALAAGARAMAAAIKKKLAAATAEPDPERVARSRKRFKNYRPLREVIRGGEGKPEYFPSGVLLLRGKGARQSWLVDQGHAGPTESSPRTPPHPYVFEGLVASEGPREKAILRSYQRQFGAIVADVKSGKAARAKAGKKAG